MTGPLDERLGDRAARWVSAVIRRPRSVLALGLLVTALLGVFSAERLGLNTDENDLFSEDLPFFDLRAEYYRVLPILADPIVVAVEGSSRTGTARAADALAARLAARSDVFTRVHRPGGGPFFERNGLLYLDPDALQERVEELFAMQPWLAELSRDPSLRGLFSTLESAVEAARHDDVEPGELARVMDEVADVAEAEAGGPDRTMAWADALAGAPSPGRAAREVLLIEPVVDFSSLQPAEAPLRVLRETVRDLGLADRDDLRVRATGVHVLATEETEHASVQARWAGAASFLLVAGLLTIGLGSVRLVVASLGTLIVGLVWTAGFAALAVGHVNLISVAFAVLFIGLSIDFAIHFCVRYRDGLVAGASREAALVDAAGRVGSSLWLCASTTAVGFYAFLPTPFSGVAELGLIAGTGMFVSLFTNLTILPAWLALLAPPRPGADRVPEGLARLLAIPIRHTRAVLGATAAACLAAAWWAPRAHFDSNPLDVRDPSTESVSLLREMLADGEAMLWSMNALAPDPEAAARLAEELGRLPSVSRTITLTDFVPDRQAEKRALVADAAYIILPTIADAPTRPPPGPEDRAAATASLLAALDEAATDPTRPQLAASARRLESALAPIARADDRDARLAHLEDRLVADLPGELAVLRRALEPGPVSLETLPSGILDRMRALDGRVRVEIEPKGNLEDMQALATYVREVQAVVPDAFGEALMILETGRTVVRALVEAFSWAALAILVLLGTLWRSVRDTALVAATLGIATWLTVAAAVAIGIPFNFADVIVMPLLLGLGVDTGIHLVQRARSEWPADGNLLRTSTARAVLLSALTTLASFGTLAFSSHGGMASLGRLLALGLALILASNLVVLPALVAITRRAR